MRKALTAGAVSGIGTAIFAAVSDGQFSQEEIAGVIGVVLSAFGLTWLIPNKPTSETTFHTR